MSNPAASTNNYEITSKTDVSSSDLWPDGRCLAIFNAMRRDCPVHYCEESRYGPYWSVTKYDDIVSVDANHRDFSSDARLGGIVIDDNIVNGGNPETVMSSFITVDPPVHSEQRKAVMPIVSQPNLSVFSDLIRQRTRNVLDSVPAGQPFDWVRTVSIELTTQMLATLFDFPFEDRHRLTRWSDVITAEPGSGVVDSQDQRVAELMECLSWFTQLREARRANPTGHDLISLIAASEAMSNLPPLDFLGNVGLLIVGGNDTTRNSMTGSILAISREPDAFAKLKADPGLVPQAIAEVIRWQTPLAHMRRTALRDVELSGRLIRKGDRVVMWYVSGNRDEDFFEDGERFWMERPNARRHLSFGFGIHRCMGLRLAEIQLKVLWEEILARWKSIEVVGEPEGLRSNFVRGYPSMTVVVT